MAARGEEVTDIVRVPRRSCSCHGRHFQVNDEVFIPGIGHAVVRRIDLFSEIEVQKLRQQPRLEFPYRDEDGRLH